MKWRRKLIKKFHKRALRNFNKGDFSFRIFFVSSNARPMNIYKEDFGFTEGKDEQFTKSISVLDTKSLDDCVNFLVAFDQKISSEIVDINFIIESFDQFSQIDYLPELFFELEMHKKLALFLESNAKEPYSKKLFHIFGNLLFLINDTDICLDLINLNIIELFLTYYMNDPSDICFTLHCFAYLAQNSVAARNRIIKNVHFQSFCMSEFHDVAFESYKLVNSLCLFGMSLYNCDYLLTLLIDGLFVNHEFAFDIIFQSIYQISFSQEKHWYKIFMEKNGKDILIFFFPNHTHVIISILKRAIETSNNLDSDLVRLFFFFREKEELSKEEQASLDTISEIYLFYAQKGIQYEVLFQFDIIGAIFFIIDNCSFDSKANATFALLTFAKFFLQINNEEILQRIFGNQLFDTCCDILSSSKVELILQILLFMTQLIEDSPTNSVLFANECLIETLASLQFHSDSLIAEKSQYLSVLIQNASSDE